MVLLGTLALGAVLYPVIRGATGADHFARSSAIGRGAGGAKLHDPPPPLDDDALDAEVARYREAIRAGSLCDRCRQANPRGSCFCAECGARL